MPEIGCIFGAISHLIPFFLKLKGNRKAHTASTFLWSKVFVSETQTTQEGSVLEM